MNYKALEDLINILVRKIGIDLSDPISVSKKNEFEKHLNEIRLSSDTLKYEKELKLTEECLKDLESKIILYASDIIDAFKNRKSYSFIKDKVDFLINESKKALENTKNMIKNSNIFEAIEENKKDINSFKKDLDEKELIDNNKLQINNFYSAYIKSKNKASKKRIEVLINQINALEKIIVVLKVEKKKIDNRNFYLKNEAVKYKEKLESLNLLTDDDVIKYEDILKHINDDIESLLKIIEEYNKEIKEYELEQKNKKEELILKQKEISLKIEIDTKDNIEYLKEMISYHKSLEKLKSISLQQQYLYVDPDIIKEEIEIIWKKNNINDFSDIEYLDI